MDPSKQVSKKARTSSRGDRALNFSLSPKIIGGGEAAVLAEQNPNLCLRMASEQDLSPKSAQRTAETWPGFNLAVWPRMSGRTNKDYEELQALRDEVLLYDVLLRTTPSISRMDVVNFVIKVLNHRLKAVAKATPDFSQRFVGEYIRRPFQSTMGEGINYARLLTFVNYLAGDSAEREGCNWLLNEVEQQLVVLVQSLGVTIRDETTFKLQVRSQVREYLSLEEQYGEGSDSRELRNIAAHPFSILLNNGHNVDLQAQELEHAFPNPTKHFQEVLLGKLMIVLSDLEKKEERGDFNDNLNLLLPIGFSLIKSFIKQRRRHQRQVVWRSHEATIPGEVPGNLPPLCLQGVGKTTLITGLPK